MTKLKVAVLREPTNIGLLGINGEVTLDTRVKDTKLTLDGNLVIVERKGQVAFIPVSNFRFLLREEDLGKS